MVGSTLGHYRVESELGAGGMGVVYEGTDTRLGRKVAIKLLHPSLLGDPERMTRFEREARVLASLNHANIAAIHGLEQANGTKFLVLEYVPGDTLDARINRGSLSFREALDVCRQIAEGLDAAHEKGIVHRDLKPANVKITPDGKVKVLDFGLAKAIESALPDGQEAETATVPLDVTRAGMVMGTSAYMSPEQACGRPVDRRTDVWAFGCVMFETLARKRTFAGDTVAEVIAAVLEREPEWNALPPALPENVRALLRRCLTKDPHRRLRDIGDARLELEETLSGLTATRSAPMAVMPAPRWRRALWPAIVSTMIVIAASAASWEWLRGAGVPAPEVVRFTHPLPQGHRMAPGWNPSVIFSPDGRTVAFDYEVDGIPTAFMRRLDELDQQPLGGVKYLSTPVFSPDGRWVVMVDNMGHALKKVAIAGGAPVQLAATDMFGRGDWGRDGYIYFTDRYPGAIQRVPEQGGPAEPVTTLDAQKREFTHRHAQLLPGGKAVMFTVVSAGMASYDDARIEIQTLDATPRRMLLHEGGFGARYSPSGHVIYAHGGNLYAVPFDARSLETKGLPVRVIEGVQMSRNTGSAYFDVSPAGGLAYVPGKVEGGARTLVWVDRDGRESPIPAPADSYLFPRISPIDENRIAVEVEGATHNLHIYDVERDVLKKLTTDGLSHAPVWTPDGRNLCFRSWKAGTMTMWSMPSDQSREAERITTVGARQSAVSVSPDGRYLAFNQMADMPEAAPAQAGSDGMGSGGSMPMSTGSDIWILPLQGEDRTPRPFKKSIFDEASPRFSRDGRWVAYCSNESGQAQVYVEAWPGPGMREQITSDGGADPIFSRDGRELFYRQGDKMMVVPVSTAGEFKAGRPTQLWAGKYSHGMSSSCGPPGVSSANYDVSADGRRFLMIKDDAHDMFATNIVVILNWAEELVRRERRQGTGDARASR